MVWLTMGISLPSFSLRYGMYSDCLGAVPEASALNPEPSEFILVVVMCEWVFVT